MVKSIVVKFGGSVLKDVSAVADAASWVKRIADNGVGVVVVVSALKGVTDELVKTAKNLSENPDPELMDEILSIGERTSARLFALALRNYGVKSVFLDPSSKLWPIITNEKHLDAEPLYEETKKKVLENLVPLLSSGVVPVVCGFLGISREGKVTTLGRGGSDTTAVLLGNCLRADEIVLVKDVPGVFSADPDEVEGAEILSQLDFREAQALVRGGAKIVHTKALRYLEKGLKLRIASLKELLTGGGTIVEGYEKELEVGISKVRVSMLTIVGDKLEGSETLGKLMNKLGDKGVKVIASASEEESLILYVEESGRILKEVHSALVSDNLGKALSIYEGLSMISISGRMLETSPGVIYRITKPLAEAGINVYGLLTISSSIRVFVSNADADRAARLIKEELSEEVKTR